MYKKQEMETLMAYSWTYTYKILIQFKVMQQGKYTRLLTNR